MSVNSRPRKVSCGLDLEFEADVESAIELACGEGFDFSLVDLVDSGQKMHFLKAEAGHKMGDNTDSKFFLNSQEWCSFVVGKISESKASECDTHAEKVMKESAILEELNFAGYLGLPAVLIRIERNNCVNLARTVNYNLLSSHHTTSIWVSVRLHDTESDSKDDSPWQMWNKFRVLCNHHNRIAVALEVTPDLPEPNVVKQWLGEPIRVVILPTSLFLTNKKGYPVLSRAHQSLLSEFFRINCQVVVTGENAHNSGMRVYQQYVLHLYENRPAPDQYQVFSNGYEDYLQAPLQPLMDNLESATYEVFEKDPVKYRRYQEAIHSCLVDRHSQQNQEEPVVLMVLGAGRGPLVRAALRAAEEAKVRVRCYAVEKNANAAVTLNLLQRTQWVNDNVTVLHGDMRELAPPELADVIVSELLGSFGDNELSPECLDGAERFLKPDAVSIPASYTSYLSPVSSQKLHNEVTAAGNLDRDKPREAAFEMPYVVRIHNYHELAEPQAAFTFTHPAAAKDNGMSNGDSPSAANNCNSVKNARSLELNFDIGNDSLLHGFAGYFECTLYKDVDISILPRTHSPGMFSWFPIFFPLFQPIHLRTNDKLSVHLWRCCSPQKVWYEWAVSAPHASCIHNPKGRSYTIGC